MTRGLGADGPKLRCTNLRREEAPAREDLITRSLAMGAAHAAPIDARRLTFFYEHSSGAGAEMMWVSDPGGRMKKK
jgi:hypothetical protein